MKERVKLIVAVLLFTVSVASIFYYNFIIQSASLFTYISYAAVISIASWRRRMIIPAATLFAGLIASSAFFLMPGKAEGECVKSGILLISAYAVYITTGRLSRSKSSANLAIADLQAILDSSVQSFLLLDENRYIRAFNKKTEEYFGLYRDRKVYAGNAIDSYIQSDKLDEFAADFKSAINGVATRKEWQLTDYKGALFWIEISMTPAFIDERVSGVCLSIYDITRRKRTERELARNEERLSKIIMYSSDIILILNLDSTIQFTGSPAVSNFGWESHEVNGKSLFDFVHPDDAVFVESRFTDAVVNRGITYARDFRIRKKNGEWARCDAIGNNMLDDPVIEGIIINLRELT